MSISRETFDPTKNYKRIRYHQDRDLLDSELNEQQDIINLERRKIAEGLARRIADGDVPETLKDRSVVALDLGAMIAGSKFRGEFEDRLKAVLREISEADGQIILFNRQAERIFGYGKGEVLGVSLERLVHEECPSFHATSAEAYLRERGDELLEGVHRLPGRRRDGARLELELSLSAAESDGHRFYTAILRERS